MGTIINESFSTNSSNSIEKNKKDEEYMSYIIAHVNNVKLAYSNFFVPLLDVMTLSRKIGDSELKDAILAAKDNIETHDASKYSEEEFDAYRSKWYPTLDETNNDELQKIIDEKSEQAWIHHYRNNPHHPGYWNDPLITDTPTKDIPLTNIIEMICDWIGMSKGNIDNMKNWYETKADKEKKMFTDNTKELVEEIIYNVLPN